MKKKLFAKIFMSLFILSCQQNDPQKTKRPQINAASIENEKIPPENVENNIDKIKSEELKSPPEIKEDEEQKTILELENKFDTEKIIAQNIYIFKGKAYNIDEIEFIVDDQYNIGKSPVISNAFTFPYSFTTPGENRKLLIKGFKNGNVVMEKNETITVQEDIQAPQKEKPQEEAKEDFKKDSKNETIKEPQSTFLASANYNSRGGTKITQIILHNTDGVMSGAVSWLRNSNRPNRTSAHLVIGRDGSIVRLIRDEHRAWHAAEQNSSSLGIEIEAYDSAKGMTKIQEEKVIQQVKYWMQKYNIKVEKLGIHRWFGGTNCPIHIWPTDAIYKSWRKTNFGG